VFLATNIRVPSEAVCSNIILMVEMINIDKFLVGEHKGNMPLATPGVHGGDIFKMVIGNIVSCGGSGM
jgi:hypothetical protein